MPPFVIELSYVDYTLVIVNVGFLAKVIRLGLWGIYSSWICCHPRCVWIVAIRRFVARFIQLRTNFVVISPIFVLLQTTGPSVFFTLSCSLMFVFLYVSLGMFMLRVVAVAGFPWVPFFFRVYINTALSGLTSPDKVVIMYTRKKSLYLQSSLLPFTSTKQNSASTSLPL